MYVRQFVDSMCSTQMVFYHTIVLETSSVSSSKKSVLTREIRVYTGIKSEKVTVKVLKTI